MVIYDSIRKFKSQKETESDDDSPIVSIELYTYRVVYSLCIQCRQTQVEGEQLMDSILPPEFFNNLNRKHQNEARRELNKAQNTNTSTVKGIT